MGFVGPSAVSKVSNDTSTQITVGEFAAACVISLHNSTYLQCDTQPKRSQTE